MTDLRIKDEGPGSTSHSHLSSIHTSTPIDASAALLPRRNHRHSPTASRAYRAQNSVSAASALPHAALLNQHPHRSLPTWQPHADDVGQDE